MRHNKAINHLGRKSGHRKALLANMATSLIMHKRIETTVAKAKALKMYVEPLITKSKEDSTHSRRMVFSYLKNKYAVTELFRNVAPKIAERPGGYTRILKTGFRKGDGADMALIELVDFNDAALASTVKKERLPRPLKPLRLRPLQHRLKRTRQNNQINILEKGDIRKGAAFLYVYGPSHESTATGNPFKNMQKVRRQTFFS